MKTSRKLLAFLLSVILLLSSMTAIAMAADNSCDCEHVPMIYIYGRQDTFDDPSSPDRVLLNAMKDDALEDLVDEALPVLKDAILKAKWDEYCDFIVEKFCDMIGDFGLSDEGEVDNTSGIDYGWSPENPNTLPDDHIYDNVYSYVFLYDARRDPLAVADDLKVFIQAVKDVTGHDTVNIVSRCMGSEYALAYFAKYGWSDVETFVQNCSSANGTDSMSEMFAGKIKLNAGSIDRYFNEQSDFDEEPFNKALVTFLHLTGTLDLGLPIFNLIIKLVVNRIIPEIMKREYGTCPGYWSMVSTKDYQDAKKLIFKGEEEKYATLIEKLDNYDKLVRSRTSELLTEMHNDGVKICTIVKYGFQMKPYTESSVLQSDDKISVGLQSYGATCPKQGKTLSKLYLKKAAKNGTDKYISPDNIIDASTCLFPETTWFMKDIRHNNFPGCVNELYVAACRSEKELTINDDERFPQFMRHYYWENSLVPLTEENAVLFEYTTNIIDASKRFWPLLKEKLADKYPDRFGWLVKDKSAEQ